MVVEHRRHGHANTGSSAAVNRRLKTSQGPWDDLPKRQVWQAAGVPEPEFFCVERLFGLCCTSEPVGALAVFGQCHPSEPPVRAGIVPNQSIWSDFALKLSYRPCRTGPLSGLNRKYPRIPEDSGSVNDTSGLLMCNRRLLKSRPAA